MEDPLDDYNPHKTSDHRDLLKELVRKQRRSSAVETLFTFALLTFSWVQLTGGSFIFGTNTVEFETSYNYGVTILYLITIVWAIGLGRNDLKIETYLLLDDIKTYIDRKI